MKILRILTGNHAGARLVLSEGTWRVQRLDPACEVWQVDEISLVDWHGEPLVLRVRPTGCVSLDLKGAEHPWPDFEVRRFGDVVLCIGEDHAIWPSDASLLSNLPSLSPVVASASVPIGSTHSMAPQLLLRNVLLVAVVGMLLLPMVLAVFGPKHIQAAQNPQTDTRAVTFMTKVKQALRAEKLHGLDVRVEQGRLRVEGLVSDIAEDALARKTLQPFDRMGVVWAWQTASQLGDTMTTALNEPGVQVRHLGGGNFVAQGSAERPDDVRAKASKLKNDFANNVRSLEVHVQSKASAQPKVSAILETGGLSYVVRPDGSKSFVSHAFP